MARRHWTEQPTPCVCGKTFRTAAHEAFHRHSFPVYCNKNRLAKALAELKAKEKANVEG